MTPAAPGSPSARPLILVVDDEPRHRASIRETLEATGYVVVEADSGPAALALLAELEPALVLLDAVLPESDGIELCRVLRERPATRHLPLVVMLDDGDEAAVHRAFALGASDFISKPVSIPLLGQRLRFLLQTQAALQELRDTQAHLNHAQRLARLGSWEWPAGGAELRLSVEGARLFGLPELRTSLSELLARVLPKDRERVEQAFQTARFEGTAFALDHGIVLDDGSVRHLHSQGVVGEAGEGGRFAVGGTCQDVSERRLAEEKIHYLVQHDPLTGLPTHLPFNAQLAYIMATARRHRHQVALLLVDLGLDTVAAPPTGAREDDEVQCQVAERLREATRQTDFIAHETPGRFSIWLPDIQDLGRVLRVLRRIRQVLEAPIRSQPGERAVAAGIGIALYPQDGADVETLLTRAETAMHNARKEGPGAFQFYSGAMDAAARRLLTLEEHLPRALERRELSLCFQPQLELGSGRIVGAEVMLRWLHQGKTPLPPEDFMPLAEANGLATPFCLWTLQEACRVLAHWQKQGLPPLRLLIGLPSPRLWGEGLGTDLARALGESGLEPSSLQLKLPAALLGGSRAGNSGTLGFLRNLGIGLALDQFGSGCGALVQFRQLPLDALVVDPSFSRDLTRHPHSVAMLRAIGQLGQTLGLQVSAAGVENASQLALLRTTGCDCALLARPLPAQAFAELVRSWRPSTPPEHLFAAAAQEPLHG